MDTLPAADVLWWNARDCYVLCPYCEEVHRHTVYYNRRQTRKSDCDGGIEYVCCFPFTSAGQVAYEINKKRARYVNICATDMVADFDAERDSEEADVDVDILAREFARKADITGDADPSLENVSLETVNVDLDEDEEGSEIDSAMLHFYRGAVRDVERFLTTSKESKTFLYGRDRYGRTMLIDAASGESAEMVALLLERGAKVNAVDDFGMSALMEAALRGRLENAQILLKHGADRDMRNHQKRCAVDLAQPTLKNRRERYRRVTGGVSVSSTKTPTYVEDTFKRDIDRQNIVRLLLGREDRVSKIVYGEPPTLSQEHYRFRLSATGESRDLSGPIEVSGPIKSYPVTKTRKTVARLERGGRFGPIGAMSGWLQDPILSVRISNRQWTEEVRYISNVIDHYLEPHRYDRDWSGQYNACHAEKQLIAYFIDRHVFLPRDSIPDEALDAEIAVLQNKHHDHLLKTVAGQELDSLRRDRARINKELMATKDEKESKQLKADLTGVEGSLALLQSQPRMQDILALERHLNQLSRKRARHEELMEMANAPPPSSLKAAVIFISSAICDDCMSFRDRVNEVFGLSIQLYEAR